MKGFKKNRFAFTLAEVLIVVGIIGIIAQLTIPTLISSYEKTVTVTRLKKAYATWNQALIKMAADGGTPGDFTSFGEAATGPKIASYFKTSKVCSEDNVSSCYDTYNTCMQACFDSASDISACMDSCQTALDACMASGKGQSGCWGVPELFYDRSVRTSTEETEFTRFITNDGISFKLTPNGSDFKCSTPADPAYTGNMKLFCGQVHIDINGLKGPNTIGKDQFWFNIANGKGPILYPWGGEDDSTKWQDYCVEPLGTYSGSYCTGRIIEEGWQINYY